MVSGWRAETYEGRLLELGLTTLEERRHRLDVQPTYRILKGDRGIRSKSWFQMAGGSEAHRDPRNIRQQPGRIEIRRTFFSNRVAEPWNRIGTSWNQNSGDG
jgi:hypothetical protein